jgi:catechol 2,3-dioxygenase-like lactoylglutathione lyase family enzyme
MIVGIAPFFIVAHVPAALAFYRDMLGLKLRVEAPRPRTSFSGLFVAMGLSHTAPESG